MRRCSHLGVWAEDPGIGGWVWDWAGGHKGADMQVIGAPQVVQPSYTPELNPVERFFQELRPGPWGTGCIPPRRQKRKHWSRS